MGVRDRLAVNPLPSHDPALNRSAAAFAQAFADLHAVGFTAVTADLPEDVDPADYLHWIGLYGLRPSPGMLLLDVAAEPAGTLARARALAEQQLLLGQDRAMITTADRAPARRRGPAALDRLVERVGAVADVLRGAGLRPLLRPRLGSAVHTLGQTTHLLDGLPGLGLAVDTAHLAAVAPHPAGLVRRHAARVGAVVLSGLAAADAVLTALPAGHDADLVLEVRARGSGFYLAHRHAYQQAQQLLDRVGRTAGVPA